MKGSRWFVLGIVAFLLLMFAIEYRLPKQFVWKPTFGHYDEQPFGCALFDSLLAVSLPSGYSLSKKTLYQLEQEDTAVHRGFLIIAQGLEFSELDIHALLKMADRGDKIMLVSNMFDDLLQDTLGFYNFSSYFSPAILKKYATSLFKKDSIYWVGDSAVYAQDIYYAYPSLCNSYFFITDSLPMYRLAEKRLPIEELRMFVAEQDTLSDMPSYPLLAWSCPWGKGEIVLVSTPLLFTNYGILDGNNVNYLFRILSRMRELPVIRTEAYMQETVQEQHSPFRYLLAHQPLRWALYLTMITIVLFMVFTAKRKQRAIPIIHEPENGTLEFTKLIGTLYYQQKDHADLVRKKFLYFSETLRREIQVDIEVVADDDRSFNRISQKTGMNVAAVRKLILELRPVVYGGRRLMEEDMKRLIDKMNEIISCCK